jgi:hypothetical protein
MPFYSNFLLPIFIFGLSLLQAWMSGMKSRDEEQG